jgi:hypothetical protein
MLDNAEYIYIYTLIHLWSWALLEKLPILQLLKNFPAFYETRKFITVFTRALQRSLSWARPIQSILSHLSNINFSIVQTSTSWSSQWSPSFRLSHQYPTCILPRPHSFYIPGLSHPPWLDLILQITLCESRIQGIFNDHSLCYTVQLLSLARSLCFWLNMLGHGYPKTVFFSPSPSPSPSPVLLSSAYIRAMQTQ